MKNILKILIVTSMLLIVGIGAVAAVEMSDFQVPSDLKREAETISKMTILNYL